MHSSLRHALTFTAATLVVAAPLAAQQQATAARAGIMGELMTDVAGVQKKLVSLAREMPQDKYEWRPGTDVRSVSEVFLHIAGENYGIPASVGVPVDPATGLKATDFAAVTKFEQQKLSRDAMVQAIDKSYAYLLKAMNDTPDATLDEKVTFFGQQMTRRAVWVATVNHMHEHLGQAIAYARSNGVVPPWSR
jgi:uncharacterized damage-inducible protein DinB